MVKRYKYISLVLLGQIPEEGAPAIASAFYLHQIEAKKLGRALIEAAEAAPEGDFVDRVWVGVEGIGIGGPPRRDQLAEFERAEAPKHG